MDIYRSERMRNRGYPPPNAVIDLSLVLQNTLMEQLNIKQED